MADKKPVRSVTDASLAGAGEGPVRPGVLSLNIRERAALYAAYMPFLQHGGLFIPTEEPPPNFFCFTRAGKTEIAGRSK
jgi:hypothetical protein